MLNVEAKFSSELDRGFVPAVLWNRAFAEAVASRPRARDLSLVLRRDDDPERGCARGSNLGRKMRLLMPDEKEKRTGQAMAAASLPKIATHL